MGSWRQHFKKVIRVKRTGTAILIVCLATPMAAHVFGQDSGHAGQGQAVVTILSKHHTELAPNVSQQDLGVKVNGKDSDITGWTPLRGAEDKLELVVLIDSSAHNLGRQFDEIKHFVQNLPPNTQVGIGYMENGHAELAGPLSSDHAHVLENLHLPTGTSASPYFCLSDLAKNWPSTERRARREVVMVTDGIDPYNRRFDPEDSYVQAAANDSVRAGLVVYSIYWNGRSGADSSASEMSSNAGQSLLVQVSQATGGRSYGIAMGNPVSFQPYLDDLALRLQNQYELSFNAPLDRKPAIESLKLKVNGFAAEVDSPQEVFVVHAGAGE